MPHQYLMRRRKPRLAHIWNGFDTACRLYSSGSMRPGKYVSTETDKGLPTCTMCEAVMRKVQRETR